MQSTSRLLLIDTVGDHPGAVLTEGGHLLAAAEFPLRSASAILLPQLRGMLLANRITFRDLAAIGVVSGPGSFTGVRTGLAMAKGLCEVTGIPLASISRLELLADAAQLVEGYAVLDAGRGLIYVREQRRTEPPRELLAPIDQWEREAMGATIVVAEQALAERIGHLGATLRQLQAIDLLRPTERCIARGGADVALSDANYVLSATQIYARQTDASCSRA